MKRVLVAFVASLVAGVSFASAAEKLIIAADPRLELMGVVGTLAQDLHGRPHLLDERAYVKDVHKHFGKYKDHPAVKMTAAFGKQFDFSRQADAVLRYSNPPEMKLQNLIMKEMLDDTGSREALDRWVDALRDFSKTTGFTEWYAKREPELEKAAARFRESATRQRSLERLEEYTGLPFQERFPIAITPVTDLLGSPVGPCERDLDIVSFIGTDRKQFDDQAFLDQTVQTMIWHEVGHSIEDILIDVYEPHLDRLSAVYSGDCVGSWYQCAKEHTVRAVMLRLATLEKGEAKAEESLRALDDIPGFNGKFPYVPQVAERLKEYEANRDKYPTLAEFFPRILDVFAAQAGASAAAKTGAGWKPEQGSYGVFLDERLQKKGVALLDQLLKNGFDADLAKERAALQYALGNEKEAAADIKAVLAVRPGDLDALILQGLYTAKLKAGADAMARMEALGKHANNLPKDKLRRAIEASPESRFFAMAVNGWLTGNTKDSAWLKPVLEARLNAVSATGDKQETAQFYGEIGDHKTSADILAKLVTAAPGDAKLHSDLGTALFKSGSKDGAETEWREAIRLDPSLLPAYLSLGYAYEAEGKSTEALELYELALAKSAPDAQLRNLVQQNRKKLLAKRSTP